MWLWQQVSTFEATAGKSVRLWLHQAGRSGLVCPTYKFENTKKSYYITLYQFLSKQQFAKVRDKYFSN